MQCDFILTCYCLFFRHVKFYDVVNYKVVHSMEYPSSILSLAIAVSFIRCSRYVLQLMLRSLSGLCAVCRWWILNSVEGLLCENIFFYHKVYRGRRVNPDAYACIWGVFSLIKHVYTGSGGTDGLNLSDDLSIIDL